MPRKISQDTGRKLDADLDVLYSLADRALADESTAGLMAATVYHLEARKLLRGIRFRCVFCGREHNTVEECNGCEENCQN